ncbi:unnamed protein product [Toxocara canis]|uniref:Uncharacterized protein n=1 Tax=Toxocara canis TaxID=6265 RepID=A0A183VAA2_TOXCA|nr:unnamed protein product [Toxocara canis]
MRAKISIVAVENVIFGDWDSEPSRRLATIFDKNRSMRCIVNIPVDGFCRFTAQLRIRFLQIHAKVSNLLWPLHVANVAIMPSPYLLTVLNEYEWITSVNESAERSSIKRLTGHLLGLTKPKTYSNRSHDWSFNQINGALEYLALLRYAYGYDWKYGDGVYVFEAMEKLQQLLGCGAKCSHLAIVGFNNVRLHVLLAQLLRSFSVRRVDFISETSEVFSEELRWFFDWHSEGVKFPLIEQVLLDLDAISDALEDRVRIAIDLVLSVFPNCHSLEIHHNFPMRMDILAHIANICENRLADSSLTLILKMLISKIDVDHSRRVGKPIFKIFLLLCNQQPSWKVI